MKTRFVSLKETKFPTGVAAGVELEPKIKDHPNQDKDHLQKLKITPIKTKIPPNQEQI